MSEFFPGVEFKKITFLRNLYSSHGVFYQDFLVIEQILLKLWIMCSRLCLIVSCHCSLQLERRSFVFNRINIPAFGKDLAFCFRLNSSIFFVGPDFSFSNFQLFDNGLIFFRLMDFLSHH